MKKSTLRNLTYERRAAQVRADMPNLLRFDGSTVTIPAKVTPTSPLTDTIFPNLPIEIPRYTITLTAEDLLTFRSQARTYGIVVPQENYVTNFTLNPILDGCIEVLGTSDTRVYYSRFLRGNYWEYTTSDTTSNLYLEVQDSIPDISADRDLTITFDAILAPQFVIGNIIKTRITGITYRFREGVNTRGYIPTVEVPGDTSLEVSGVLLATTPVENLSADNHNIPDGYYTITNLRKGKYVYIITGVTS